MSNRRRRILGLLLAATLLVVGVTGYAVYRVNEVGIKSLKTMSSVAELNHALHQYFTDHPGWIGPHPFAEQGQPIAINPELMQRLLTDASLHYGGDAAVAGDVTVDAWHRPLRLELSMGVSGRVVHRIASSGADRTEGTPDDITFSSDIFSVPTTHPD